VVLRKNFKARNTITVDENWNKKDKAKIELKENMILSRHPMVENQSVAFEEILLSISIKINRIII
jgi:hypothetical protein